MKRFQNFKSQGIICVFVLALFFLPFNGFGQRFGHGGGGGGSRGGGGAHFGGTRTINGGSRNFGNHFFGGRGGESRGPAFGIRHSDNVFHRGFGYHPYFYHPYHPYFWGPYWHPFGYFVTALSVDAFMFNIANEQYYYDNGVYYTPTRGGYSVVAPPIGATVRSIPAGYETVVVGDATYYYYGGAFYISQGGSFRVVPAPVGAIVSELPDGATQQQINGENFLLYNNTYYQPISQNGQDAYEVVQVN